MTSIKLFTVTITAGDTFTDTAHGLTTTPDAEDFSVTPQSDMGGVDWRIPSANIDATNFRLEINGIMMSDAVFSVQLFYEPTSISASSAYCTAALVRAYSQIACNQVGYSTTNDLDDFLDNNLIPHASKIIDNYVGHSFGTPTIGTLTFDGSGKAVLFLSLTYTPFIGVSAGSVDNVGITASDIKIHDQYLERVGGVFSKGKKNVTLYGSYGYSSLPSDIEFACAQLCANVLSDMVRRKVYPDLFMPMSANGGEAGVLMANPKVFTTAIKEVLDPYKLTTIDIG